MENAKLIAKVILKAALVLLFAVGLVGIVTM